jgi:hypothetical protein
MRAAEVLTIGPRTLKVDEVVDRLMKIECAGRRAAP